MTSPWEIFYEVFSNIKESLTKCNNENIDPAIQNNNKWKYLDSRINPIKKKSNSKNVPLSWDNHKRWLNLRLEENVLAYNVNVLLIIVFKLYSGLTSKHLIYNLRSFMELLNHRERVRCKQWGKFLSYIWHTPPILQ